MFNCLRACLTGAEGAVIPNTVVATAGEGSSSITGQVKAVDTRGPAQRPTGDHFRSKPPVSPLSSEIVSRVEDEPTITKTKLDAVPAKSNSEAQIDETGDGRDVFQVNDESLDLYRGGFRALGTVSDGGGSGRSAGRPRRARQTSDLSGMMELSTPSQRMKSASAPSLSKRDHDDG